MKLEPYMDEITQISNTDLKFQINFMTTQNSWEHQEKSLLAELPV